MKLKVTMPDLIFLGVFIIACLILFQSASNNQLYPILPLKDNINLASIFSGTLIIIALIERTIELFVSALSNSSGKTEEDRNNVRKITLYIGLIMGLCASLLGIRILEPLVNMTSLNGDQKEQFIFFDVIFSAMGIATGSQLFHIFPSLTSSVLGAVKAQSEANKQSAVSQQAQTKQTKMQSEEFEGEMELARLEKI